MVAPNSLERQPVKRRFIHALNLIHRIEYLNIFLPDHVKYFTLNPVLKN